MIPSFHHSDWRREKWNIGIMETLGKVVQPTVYSTIDKALYQ